MDKLQQIFDLQAALNDEIDTRHGNTFSVAEWEQKLTLAMIAELSEVIDEVNYRWWKNPKPIDEDKLKEEIIDVAHFLFCMALRAGMSADEFFERYRAKNEENVKRQHGTSEKRGYC